MAPTVKWQRWDSASYDWQDRTTSGAAYAIEQEVDAWISVVNGHSSNSSMQISKLKGYSDGSGNANGIVLKVTDGVDDVHFGMFTSSTTNRKGYVTRTWTDDGGNNGYGTFGSDGGIDTSMSWKSSGSDFDALIVYDTTEGSEFLLVGQAIGSSTNYQDCYSIYKTEGGKWFMFLMDGGSADGLGYVDGVGWVGADGVSPPTTGSSLASPQISPSYSYYKYTPSPGASPAGESNLNPPNFTVNNDNYFARSSLSSLYDFGSRRVLTDLGNGNDVYILTTGYLGVSILMDLS